MILAAGRGVRMMPLTDATPKPLLAVAGKAMIIYHLEALVRAGIDEVVINHAWLGEQIVARLGDGRAFGLNIHYSDEGEGALETAGGIIKALPLLGNAPFMVINADIWTDFPLRSLPTELEGLAHLVMVDNPPHHAKGDFALVGQRLQREGLKMLTFSGMGVYRPELFTDYAPQILALAPILRQAMDKGEVTGEHYLGRWRDIGTPERLRELDQELCSQHG